MLFKEVADHHLITSMGAGGQGIQIRQRLLGSRWRQYDPQTMSSYSPTDIVSHPRRLESSQHHCENVRSHTIRNLFENVYKEAYW